MASSNKKFNKKLALTVAIPAIIMAVIIAVIGVSFAWFTDTATTEIATIEMSVGEVFVMDFVLDSSTKYDKKFSGETAFDSSGLLVSEIHGIEQKGYDVDSQMYTNYINDRAFFAPFNLRLDTVGYTVDFTCKISNVDIRNPENTAISPIVLPGNNGTPENLDDDLTEEDIKLGFTWYISGNNKLYTPYGTINDVLTTQTTTNPSITTDIWDVPILNSGFVASAGEENSYNYTFNIVFAPEVLYWQQYGKTTYYNQTAEDIYGDSTVDGGFMSSKWNAINKYSSQVYSGSSYKFTVVLTVSSADIGE